MDEPGVDTLDSTTIIISALVEKFGERAVSVARAQMALAGADSVTVWEDVVAQLSNTTIS